MDVNQSSLDAIYAGWCNYQGLLTASLAPLTPQQLAFQSAPQLRTIEEIATHIIGARARWFDPPLGDGSKLLAAYRRWDRRGEITRTAAEIVQGLQFTLEYLHTTIAGWSPADWQQTMPGEGSHEPAVITRQWAIWHLIEHDLHHGGEISLTLGIHKLAPPDL